MDISGSQLEQNEAGFPDILLRGYIRETLEAMALR